MKYNHAFTLAYTVVSSDAETPTFEEMKAGFLRRVGELLSDERELYDALMSEMPYDTFVYAEED